MKRIVVGALLLLLAVGVGIGAKQLYAGTGESGRGFLLGGSEMTDTNGAALPNNGGTAFDGDEPLGWLSMNNLDGADNPVYGAFSYGVNIPNGDGDLSGYAWAGNAGDWLHFGEAVGCDIPNGVHGCRAYREGNAIKGWARFVGIRNNVASGNDGGWSGWVRLNGTWGNVTITGTQLGGFAWSGHEELGTAVPEYGWISFAKATIKQGMALTICPSGLSLNVGQILPFTALYGLAGTFDCNSGASVDVTGVAVWTTSNAAVATVVAGQVTGVAGTASANITATHLGASDTKTVTVNACAPLGQAAACAASPQYDLTCKDGTNSYQVVDCGTTYDCDGNRKCDFNEVERPQ